MMNETDQRKNDGSRVGLCVLCDYHGPESGHICKVAHIQNGYEIHVNGRRYLSDQPSMCVSAIKKMVDHSYHYQTQQWHPETGTWTTLDDNNAVDLRTSPHIHFVPLATY